MVPANSTGVPVSNARTHQDHWANWDISCHSLFPNVCPVRRAGAGRCHIKPFTTWNATFSEHTFLLLTRLHPDYSNGFPSTTTKTCFNSFMTKYMPKSIFIVEYKACNASPVKHYCKQFQALMYGHKATGTETMHVYTPPPRNLLINHRLVLQVL